MKKISKSEILEIPETIENGSAKVICDKPYRLERLVKDDEVIWFGYAINWKRVGNQWYELIGREFEPCGIPEYEKLYQQII